MGPCVDGSLQALLDLSAVLMLLREIGGWIVWVRHRGLAGLAELAELAELVEWIEAEWHKEPSVRMSAIVERNLLVAVE